MSRNVRGNKAFQSHLPVLELLRAASGRRAIITLIESSWLSSFSAALIYSSEYKWVFDENYSMGNTRKACQEGPWSEMLFQTAMAFLKLLASESPARLSQTCEPGWLRLRKKAGWLESSLLCGKETPRVRCKLEVPASSHVLPMVTSYMTEGGIHIFWMKTSYPQATPS